MLLPQPQCLVGGTLVSLVCGVDVVEHLGEFPAEAVKIEASCPKRRPPGCGVSYPGCSLLGAVVAAVSGDDLGDRGEPGPTQALEVGPAGQQRLSHGVASGGSPQVRKRPRRQRPEPALDTMSVNGADMAASDRPAQRDLAWRRYRGRSDAEHFATMGQHVRVDQISLGRTGDRLTQPGRVTIGHETNLTARRGHRMGQRQPRPRGWLGHHQRPAIGFETLRQLRQPGQRRRCPEVFTDLATDGDLMRRDHRRVDPDRHDRGCCVHFHGGVLPFKKGRPNRPRCAFNSSVSAERVRQWLMTRRAPRSRSTTSTEAVPDPTRHRKADDVAHPAM